MVDGLWLWRQPHPGLARAVRLGARGVIVAVRSGGARVLLDPLAPPPSAREAWDRIEAFAADTVVILKPDHVRDVDLFVRWYGVRALGPVLFWRDDIPKTELEQIAARRRAAGRAAAFDDGRGMMETPVYLPEQRALVFADGADRARRRAARVGLRAARASARCRRCASCSSCRSST